MQHNIPIRVQQIKPSNIIEIENKLNDLENIIDSKNINDISLVSNASSLKNFRHQLLNYAKANTKYATCINEYLNVFLSLVNYNTNSYLNSHLYNIKKSK